MPRVRVDEVGLNYEQEGAGTDLVLIHGLGSDLTIWDAELIPGLVQTESYARAVVSTSEAMIAGLKLEIALLRRDKYGRSAERTARDAARAARGAPPTERDIWRCSSSEYTNFFDRQWCHRCPPDH